MSVAGAAARALASVTAIFLICWQSPVMTGILVFSALLSIHGWFFMRLLRKLEDLTGKRLRRALALLLLESAAAIVANAAVVSGTIWAARAY
jgi:hypothetical protein